MYLSSLHSQSRGIIYDLIKYRPDKVIQYYIVVSYKKVIYMACKVIGLLYLNYTCSTNREGEKIED